MAERRKNKKKKDIDIKERDAKPSKEEYAIAKYLKAKLPEKKTTLLGHKVEYMIASKAVDCLLESPWANPDKKTEVYFPNRDSVLDFMEKLLIHKFFHRAKKIVVQRDPKKKKKESEETVTESGKEKESKKVKGKADSGEKSEEKSEEKKEIAEVVEKKKEKKKIKLDMHLEQIFIDSNEPYVWIYDPIPVRTWIIGSLMVVGAVLVCLFPLWPQTIRHYIYYLSVAAAFFLAFIIGLAVVRFIVFILIWVMTFGKHHFWLLPNLTEDVGFFESFWPLYKYEYKGAKDLKKEKGSSKEKQKDKGVEDSKKERDQAEDQDSKSEEEKDKEEDQEKSGDSSSDQEQKGDDQAQTESEHESDAEKTSVDNGFELVDAVEVLDLVREGSEEDDEEDGEEDGAEDRKTK